MNDFQNDLKNWYILDNKFRDLSLQLNIIKNEKNEIKNKITLAYSQLKKTLGKK